MNRNVEREYDFYSLDAIIAVGYRVNSKKEYMGLQTWKNAPDGKILETDVVVAKNYLNEEEIKELNNLVSMYLDFVERQVKLGHIISMKEWKEKLEYFSN